ncbi:MAG: heat shock protein HspQ [Rhodospirillaceae bacterium]
MDRLHDPFAAAVADDVPRVIASAKFEIGTPVKHRVYGFRGVIFDVDPVFNNTEEWWENIPEDVRPRKDQPFYHLLAETPEPERSPYIAYVSEQNLVPEDRDEDPIDHPELEEFFVGMQDGRFILRQKTN